MALEILEKWTLKNLKTSGTRNSKNLVFRNLKF